MRKVLYVLFLSLHLTVKADEGMYPISMLNRVPFAKSGLQISPQDIFNPKGISLVDAVVSLGGCSGSFVSPDGLVITNHHCAFGAAVGLSDTINNYALSGFTAFQKSEEKKINMRVKVNHSYEDVSAVVLQGADSMADPIKRILQIQQNIQMLVREDMEKHPGLTSEISEMFAGKMYMLFRYQIYTDIRMVYIPPKHVGEYGGEKDNWEWPRHSGDFALIRVYADSQGLPAPYRESNVPLHPKNYLKINPQGAQEFDPIFILGYPGRTFRHQPSWFLQYEKEYRLPRIQQFYDWQIKGMEKVAQNNNQLKLYFSPRIKSLANTEKNYRGKIQGLKRIPLVDEKRKEDADLALFIQSTPDLSARYGNVMRRMDEVWKEKLADGDQWLWVTTLISTPGVFRVAYTINAYRREMTALQKTKWEALIKQNARDVRAKMSDAYGIYHPEFDKIYLSKMFEYAVKNSKIRIFKNTPEVTQDNDPVKGARLFALKLASTSRLNQHDTILSWLERKPEKVFRIDDELIGFAENVRLYYNFLDARRQKQDAELNRLMADYVAVKERWKKDAFIPDANGTLRFTFGRIKSFQPSDGITSAAFTTLEGIYQKSDNTSYIMPEAYYRLIAEKNYGQWKDEKLGSVPVNFIYNLDTTGGNSGSPILNGKGEFIGVNFDRSFTATINDYAWNENYSRSVGCDVRYIFWVMEKLSGANHLVSEMGGYKKP